MNSTKGAQEFTEGKFKRRAGGVAPHSRDTYPDTCPNFFDRINLIFFRYMLLGCDFLCYCVSNLDLRPRVRPDPDREPDISLLPDLIF